MKPEYILCAAIHYHFYQYKTDEHKNALPKNIQDGIVISGRRHHNCIGVYHELTGIPTRRDSSTQGFLTNLNRFVDRKEGYQIARAAGQLQHDMHDKSNPILISEDLY